MKWIKLNHRFVGLGLGVLVIGFALTAMLAFSRPSAVSAAPAAQATATVTKTPRPTRTPAPTALPKVRKFPVVRTSTAWGGGGLVGATWDDIRGQLGLVVPPAGCVLDMWFAVESGGGWVQVVIQDNGDGEVSSSVASRVRLSVVSVSLTDAALTGSCVAY